jgi:LmbE family N-acetylglucosaminyl deacetylase
MITASKILFVFAHPDDEAYGPAGTINRLSQNNHVTVLSLCKGDRPGSEEVAQGRIDAFESSCKLLGVRSSILLDYSDCRLEYAPTLLEIEKVIARLNPDVVYTHNISDIHKDHRLVAECCMVACRPKVGSSIKQLYFCEMPSSTAWSIGELTPVFNPNVYVDITEFIEVKKTVLELYGTETYEFPDARSIEAVETLAKMRGFQSGVNYAEAFKLIFSKD